MRQRLSYFTVSRQSLQLSGAFRAQVFGNGVLLALCENARDVLTFVSTSRSAYSGPRYARLANNIDPDHNFLFYAMLGSK